ncbi:DUF4430 domain-containing protein [Patescibacteria group bacterium]|nr:DUF4430 domain-containing protein [Patescibacteria group bacterium]
MKKFLLALFVLVLVGGGWRALRRQPGIGMEVPPPAAVEQVRQGVTLVLDFGDGNISTYSGVPAESTVYGALEHVAREEGLAIDSQQYDFGIFVKAIGGKESLAERAWIYIVNGESGDVAADKKVVRDGDLIEWRYIEPK